MAKEKPIGKVAHYFGNLGVGVIKLSNGELKVGDKIRIKGQTTDYEQVIKSIQIDKEAVESIKSGDDAGIKLDQKVREGDKVYLA